MAIPPPGPPPRVLLDTNVFLWALRSPGRLSGPARAWLEDPATEVLFSAATIWEVGIKCALGRADFPYRPEVMLAEAERIGFVEVPIRAALAGRVADLPPHHRDPFDRLIVAQALHLPARLLTADAALRAYSDLVTLATC